MVSDIVYAGVCTSCMYVSVHKFVHVVIADVFQAIMVCQLWRRTSARSRRSPHG